MLNHRWLLSFEFYPGNEWKCINYLFLHNKLSWNLRKLTSIISVSEVQAFNRELMIKWFGSGSLMKNWGIGVGWDYHPLQASRGGGFTSKMAHSWLLAGDLMVFLCGGPHNSNWLLSEQAIHSWKSFLLYLTCYMGQLHSIWKWVFHDHEYQKAGLTGAILSAGYHRKFHLLLSCLVIKNFMCTFNLSPSSLLKLNDTKRNLGTSWLHKEEYPVGSITCRGLVSEQEIN